MNERETKLPNGEPQGVHYEIGPLSAPTREALEGIARIMGWPTEKIKEVKNAIK